MQPQSIAGGETRVFSIDVPAQNAARIVVRQQGVDVGLTMTRPGETKPSRLLDIAGGIIGEEILVLPVSDAPATWEVTVQPVLPRTARGEFTLSQEIAPADEHARALANAWQIFRENYYTPGGEAKVYEKTVAGYARAAELGLAAGDKVLAGEGTYQSARMRDQLGDTPDAIEWQRRALALFRETGRRDREARSLNRLGDYSRKISEVTDAQRYFNEALPIAREVQDRATEVDILNNSALLLEILGRWEDAIAQIEDAIPLAKAIGSDDVESALTHNLGECWSRLGVYDKAIVAYQRSQELKRSLNLPRRESITLRGMAAAQLASGDTAAATESIRTALDLAEKSGDRTGFAQTLGFYALLQHQSGHSAEAVEKFARALPMLRESQSRIGQVDVLNAWAQVDIDRNDSGAALAKLDEALPIARAAVNRYGEAQGFYLRALALRKTNDGDGAIAAIEHAIEIVASNRTSIARSEFRTSYMAKIRRYFDLYIDLLQQRGLTAKAFQASEASRARTLLEALSESPAAGKGIDPALLRQRRALQAELSAKENYRAQLLLKDKQGARVPAVSAAIEKLQDDLTAVEARLRETSPAWSALEMPQPISVAEVKQSLVDSNTALIEYHLGTDRSYAWVVDRTTAKVFTLPGAASVERLARRYHELLSEIPSVNAIERKKQLDEIASAGRKLAAAIWKPVAAKRLLIVADGALQYVPFSALPAGGGQPLLEQHEIVYLPSASVLASIRRGSRRLTSTATAAVFADPVFSKDDERLGGSGQIASVRGAPFSRLMFSRDEAKAIVAAAGPKRAFQALDFSAAKQTLTATDLRGYRILHFATHGVLNTEQPELSGLVLSLFDANGKPVDGYLRLREIYNLNLDADLVVLSACRTALGKEVNGEGLIGLTRGFMYAGASRVVSSIWSVDDRASAQLMSKFYAATLTRGIAPSAALREAQLALLHQPRFANPHYWAAFGLQGEWR